MLQRYRTRLSPGKRVGLHQTPFESKTPRFSQETRRLTLLKNTKMLPSCESQASTDDAATVPEQVVIEPTEGQPSLDLAERLTVACECGQRSDVSLRHWERM